jgi:phosphoribosyl-ATP pyrophosphohydrolase/phosphoribosyl-AMP cyclohydrolase
MAYIDQLDFDKLNGLVPAVIIDTANIVLMVGFMNREALQKTIETKKVTFYSRSKKRLWTKGESSGNFLNVVEVKKDCDNDTLLIRARPDGNVCHTGDYTCFGEDKPKDVPFLTYLEDLIDSRKRNMPEKSYTTKLFQQGENRIIQKLGEEAIETVIAAKNNDRDELINETSDLIFHLLVLLAQKEIRFDEVISELEKRHKK